MLSGLVVGRCSESSVQEEYPENSTVQHLVCMYNTGPNWSASVRGEDSSSPPPLYRSIDPTLTMAEYENIGREIGTVSWEPPNPYEAKADAAQARQITDARLQRQQWPTRDKWCNNYMSNMCSICVPALAAKLGDQVRTTSKDSSLGNYLPSGFGNGSSKVCVR